MFRLKPNFALLCMCTSVALLHRACPVELLEEKRSGRVGRGTQSLKFNIWILQRLEKVSFQR